MKHLGYNIRRVLSFLPIMAVFASSPLVAEEYFQEAVFEELDRIGVDTQNLKTKLHEGDYSGAKSLLEEEKGKTSLSDVEEEVADLIARKVLRKVRLSKDSLKEPIYEEEAPESSAPLRNMPVEKVRLDDEEEVRESAQIRKMVSHQNPVPGEEVNPYLGLMKAGVGSGIVESVVHATAPAVDKEALRGIGIRELKPGMSIFRFLKVQVKVWARLNHTLR